MIRKRSPGVYVEPGEVVEVAAVRDRHDPAARVEAARLVRDRVRDARDRVGVARDEPRDAVARPSPSARTARLSARRCGWATSESRRSATHFAPVARFTAAPTRWTEFGGEVVRTTSMPSLARDADRGRESRSGSSVTFSSGTSSRRDASRACTSARSSPSCRAAPPRAGGPSARRSARGAPRPASARAARRRRGSTSGRPGASTCVSIPSAGRCCANLSGRCTPPPPAGGK